MNSSQLKTWIYEQTGMTVTPANSATITVALQRLARESQVSPADYAGMILSNLIKSDPFIDAITIHESYFLRHKLTMTYVIDRLLPDYMRNGGNARILSIPCANGEEPYSLAMMLSDAGISLDRVSIQGIDISRPCLEQAKKGEYRKYALRNVDDDFQMRHFQQVNDDFYRIKNPKLKRCVNFSSANLFKLGSGVSSTRFHVIFCQNLLIYFDQQKQLDALSVLADMLEPDGSLFVDISEAQIATDHLKRLHVNREVVVFKRNGAKQGGVAPKPIPGWSAAPVPSIPVATTLPPEPQKYERFSATEKAKKKPPTGKTLHIEALRLYRDKKLESAGRAFQELIREFPKYAPMALTGLARICADQGDYIEAMENAEMALEHRWADTMETSDRVESYAIIGLALRQKGLNDAATSHFLKVKKLDPTHPVVRLL